MLLSRSAGVRGVTNALREDRSSFFKVYAGARVFEALGCSLSELFRTMAGTILTAVFYH